MPNDTNGGVGTNNGSDIFVHDRKTRRTERVSVEFDGREINRRNPTPAGFGLIWSPAISLDGRYVVFVCDCNSSVSSASDGPSAYPKEPEGRAIVADRASGAITAVPRLRLDSELHGNEESLQQHWPDISRGGRFVTTAAWVGRVSPLIDAGIFLVDRGEAVGTGGLKGSGGSADGPDEDDRLCIEEVCVPPLGAATIDAPRREDRAAGKLGRAGSLIGAAVAYRPSFDDLYVTLELDHMPPTPALATATAGVVYGMAIETAGRSYELRASSTGLGHRGETTARFGLFDCSSGESTCNKVADLRGGFGTTGARITFSVPLRELGVRNGSVISEASAFTSLGFSGGRRR